MKKSWNINGLPGSPESVKESQSSNFLPPNVSRRQILKLATGSVSLGLLPPIAAAQAPVVPVKASAAPMKILMLTGSPHRKGTTSVLADAFIDGASAKGHQVTRIDTAFEQVAHCQGCEYCASHNGQCIQQDAMQKILPQMLAADMMVLVSPLHFFALSVQLMTVIGRLRAQRVALREHPMKVALLVAGGSNTEWNMEAVVAHYKVLQRYLPWKDQGMVLAKNVPTPQAMMATSYPAQARALGASL